MRKVFLVTLLIASLVVFNGCAKKVDASQVRSFADPMTENLLIAMNNKDYRMFSRDLGSKMKRAIPESRFYALVEQVNGKVGMYIPDSKQFYRAYKIGEFTNVIYKAKFSKENSPVTVRVVFDVENGKEKISGLWFDSPTLRKR